ncbi:MAG TPA: sigma-70 family RNA polymerase sigma factor, partial [Gemmataceae bacterium]|nr:sigma-70 family RNA polymerase sigma factor [Gemmataceae bacterium]
MPTQRLTDVLRQLRANTGPEGADPASDRELLDGFASGRDQAAFERLVARHGPMVLDVCRRGLANEADAEDAFQATFLVLARKAGRIGWGELVANWLYGVARRTAARARVEAAKRRARESAAPSPQASPDPLDRVTARELLDLLDEEISRVPVRYRGPLVACHLEGKTRDEAAEEFGWSLATLARRLERGRKLLGARLARRGLALAVVGPLA